MTTNRILPEQVKQAYEETGLKPQDNLFLSGGCGCGIGVMFARSTGKRSYETTEALEEMLGLSSEYTQSYSCGFAGEVLYDEEGDGLLGYEDGLAARALLGLGK